MFGFSSTNFRFGVLNDQSLTNQNNKCMKISTLGLQSVKLQYVGPLFSVSRNAKRGDFQAQREKKRKNIFHFAVKVKKGGYSAQDQKQCTFFCVKKDKKIKTAYLGPLFSVSRNSKRGDFQAQRAKKRKNIFHFAVKVPKTKNSKISPTAVPMLIFTFLLKKKCQTLVIGHTKTKIYRGKATPLGF